MDEITTHNYGMSLVKHRTSFALDDQTIVRLRRLAARWDVSQAEVVRRAVEIADQQDQRSGSIVAERLRVYQARQSLDRERLEAYLSDVRDQRGDWRSAP